MPHHGEFDSINTICFQPPPVLKGPWEEILLTVINVRTPLPRACITELHGLQVAAILIFLPFPLQQKKGEKAAFKSRYHKEEENVSYFELRKELLLLLYSLFVYKHQFACGLCSVCLFVHLLASACRKNILKWETFGVEWQKQSLQVHVRQAKAGFTCDGYYVAYGK